MIGGLAKIAGSVVGVRREWISETGNFPFQSNGGKTVTSRLSFRMWSSLKLASSGGAHKDVTASAKVHFSAPSQTRNHKKGSPYWLSWFSGTLGWMAVVSDIARL